MSRRDATVAIGIGLRARAATTFVKRAAASEWPVTIGRAAGHPVDATSIMSVLGLDLDHGEDVVLASEDESVLDDLAELLSREAV